MNTRFACTHDIAAQKDTVPMARVLIIDDDVPTRRMLRQALERAGYAVSEAQEGHEGMQHCQAAHFDVVITDILMPDQEGLETIRLLSNSGVPLLYAYARLWGHNTH